MPALEPKRHSQGTRYAGSGCLVKLVEAYWRRNTDTFLPEITGLGRCRGSLGPLEGWICKRDGRGGGQEVIYSVASAWVMHDISSSLSGSHKYRLARSSRNESV